MKPVFRSSSRPIVLLEVLIAFALIALCILPLIYPHVFILRSERKFIATVELDHVVNLLYADRLQKLYQNEISWQEIEGGNPIAITPSMIESAGYAGDLPFTGTYRFVKILQKPKEPKDRSAYLFSLEFTFKAKPGQFLEKKSSGNESNIIYKYQVPMERVL